MNSRQLQAILGVIDKETDTGQLSVIAGRVAQRSQFLSPPEARGGGRGSRRVGKAVPNNAGLVIGDKVIFTDHISPRYLIGREAEVVGTNQKSVIVKCPEDSGYGRFSGKGSVRCANDLVRKKEVRI